MQTWNIVTKVVDGEEVAVIYDMFNRVITKKEFDKIVAQANKFYALPEIEHDVDTHNRYENFNQMYGMSHYFGDLEVGEKIEMPMEVYSFTSFNPYTERKWSCKCGLCGTRISNQKDDGYYSLVFHHHISNLDIKDPNHRRACSDKCAKVLWRDIFKNWVMENGYKEFFILD